MKLAVTDLYTCLLVHIPRLILAKTVDNYGDTVY